MYFNWGGFMVLYGSKYFAYMYVFTEGFFCVSFIAFYRLYIFIQQFITKNMAKLIIFL